MDTYDIILKKRDGGNLSAGELDFMIKGIVSSRIPDYQIAAFLMAVFIRGMSRQETIDLTCSMMKSGEEIIPDELGPVTADKHSTGGVGDKVSIPLAPLVASAGVRVPMMSGRGLGHTGGTLDKLESIPGFSCIMNKRKFIEAMETVGAAIIGQTEKLVPADKKLYALRDVTATIDSIPLIAASIMSKKIAAGPRAIVFDVKIGSGSFLKYPGKAAELAELMIDIGSGLNRNVSAYITQMDQPLGRCVGNALEIKESILFLKGEGPEDLKEIVFKLGAEMLLLSGKSSDLNSAEKILDECLASGQALQKFQEMIQNQGGDTSVIDDAGKLPSAEKVTILESPESGYIEKCDALQIGRTGVSLGAGRERMDSVVDPSVGFVLNAKKYDYIEKGEPLLEIHHSADLPESFFSRLRSAYSFSEVEPTKEPLIIKRIAG